MQVTFDALNRLDGLSNRTAGGATMTRFKTTCDAGKNITRIDLNQQGTTAAWRLKCPSPISPDRAGGRA